VRSTKLMRSGPGWRRIGRHGLLPANQPSVSSLVVLQLTSEL
jgi:hypothetical protein